MKKIAVLFVLFLFTVLTAAAQQMASTDLDRYTRILGDLSDGKKTVAEDDIKWSMSVEPKLVAADYVYVSARQAQARNYRGAEATLTACAKKFATSIDCFYRRGIIRVLAVGYGVALEDFNEVIRLDPRWPNGYQQRAGVYKSLKRDAEALADLNKAIELKPDYSRALSARGQYYDEKGEKDKAFADYTAAIKADPKDNYALSARARYYASKEDLANALADYNAALALNISALDLTNRGDVLWRMGRRDEAEADFQKALAMDPKMKTLIDTTKLLYRDKPVKQ